jgi:hypothetical protein
LKRVTVVGGCVLPGSAANKMRDVRTTPGLRIWTRNRRREFAAVCSKLQETCSKRAVNTQDREPAAIASVVMPSVVKTPVEPAPGEIERQRLIDDKKGSWGQHLFFFHHDR